MRCYKYLSENSASRHAMKIINHTCNHWFVKETSLTGIDQHELQTKTFSVQLVCIDHED